MANESNQIPGARGCTPQACSLRDASDEFRKLGVGRIFSLSVQDTPYQQEVKQRLHLPYHLLSNQELALKERLKPPTFDWHGEKLIRRLSLAIKDGKIIKVWYPVFPPNKSAKAVLLWLKGPKNAT